MPRRERLEGEQTSPARWGGLGGVEKTNGGVGGAPLETEKGCCMSRATQESQLEREGLRRKFGGSDPRGKKNT